jgi:hypothetical protein
VFVDIVCLCAAGPIVLRPYQCSVFYGRRFFWFVLLNQPDVGCGSVKLRRGGRNYARGEYAIEIIIT